MKKSNFRDAFMKRFNSKELLNASNNGNNNNNSDENKNNKSSNNKIELYLFVDRSIYSGSTISLLNADFYDNGLRSDDDFVMMSLIAKDIHSKNHYDLCMKDFHAMGCPFLGGTGIVVNGRKLFFDLLDECNYDIRSEKKGTFSGMDDELAYPNGLMNKDITDIVNGLNNLFTQFVIIGVITDKTFGPAQRVPKKRLSDIDDDYDSLPKWWKDMDE